MKYYLYALVLLKRLLPSVIELAKNSVDGKITKEELKAVGDKLAGEDGVIYLWGRPDAK